MAHFHTKHESTFLTDRGRAPAVIAADAGQRASWLVITPRKTSIALMQWTLRN
jgi:hypothetical protein